MRRDLFIVFVRCAIVSLLETVEPICVDCVLHDKYEENQALIIPLIP